MKEDFSLPRNPTIAKIFRFVKLAENIGSGFHKMIDGWKQHYKLEPVIEGDFDYYKITFPLTEKGPSQTTDKTTDKKFSDKEKAILDLIIANPGISQKEIADDMGLTVDGVRYHMDKLKEIEVLKRVGGKKSGKWVVNNKTMEDLNQE